MQVRLQNTRQKSLYVNTAMFYMLSRVAWKIVNLATSASYYGWTMATRSGGWAGPEYHHHPMMALRARCATGGGGPSLDMWFSSRWRPGAEPASWGPTHHQMGLGEEVHQFWASSKTGIYFRSLVPRCCVVWLWWFLIALFNLFERTRTNLSVVWFRQGSFQWDIYNRKHCSFRILINLKPYVPVVQLTL